MKYHQKKKRLAVLALSLFLSEPVALAQQALPTSVNTNSHPTAANSAAVATASSVPISTSSHGTSTNPNGINLDLSSVTATLNPGHLVNTTPVNIQVGNLVQSVTNTSILTPAEMLAVYQVVKTGTQSIVLGQSGNAVGGSLNIGSHFSNYVSSLVIPQGVTVIDKAPSLNLAGNLSNMGTLFAVSNNPAVTSTSITASNISNAQGGLITTVLPAGGLTGFSNLVSGLNLNLNAINSITNAGVISSAGALNISAGNTITNALPTAATSGTPVMQAMGDLNLTASNIVNAGIMSSQLSNVSAMTASLTNSGAIQALSGSIAIQNIVGNQLSVNNTLGAINARDNISFSTLGNVLDSSGTIISKANLNVLGGDMAATNIYFSSPNGILNAQTNSMIGAVNVDGGIVEVGSNIGGLNIASMHVTGDPIFFSHDQINGLTLNLSAGNNPTGGGDFVALSEGDIKTSQGAAATIDATGAFQTPGGQIVLAAGVNFTPASPTLGNYSIGAPTAHGGNVALANVSLKTNSNIVQIEAHSGVSAGSVQVGNIDTSGFGAPGGQSSSLNGDSAGTVTVTGDGNVSTGSIRAYGGGGNGGGAGGPGFGGNGATVTLISNNGNLSVLGDINTSGGGGGAGSSGNFGADGGGAGNISATALGTLTITGPVLAAGGAGGGGVDVGVTLPGGGGSFGGGGGGFGGGAGGGGFFGGGGTSSGGTGGGGGQTGGSGDSTGIGGVTDGSAGSGGNGFDTGTSTATTGGLFGTGGQQGGSSVGGTQSGSSGFNGSDADISLQGQSVSITKTVGGSFAGTGFTNSPFANVLVYGQTVSISTTSNGNITLPTGGQVIGTTSSSNAISLSPNGTGIIDASNQNLTLNASGLSTSNHLVVSSPIVASTATILSQGFVDINNSITAAGGIFIAGTRGVTATAQGSIDTSSSVGSAGKITVVAGGKYTTPTANSVLFSGTQSGSISLGSISALKSNSTAANGAGGDITLVAYHQGFGPNGNVTLPAGLTVDAGGGSGGANGTITLVNGSATNGISVGTLTTSSGLAGTGGIILSNSDAVSNVTVSQGANAGTVTSGSFLGGTFESTSMTAVAINAPTSYVQIRAGVAKNNFPINANSVALVGQSVQLTNNIDAPGGILLLAKSGISAQFNGLHLSTSSNGNTGNIAVIANAAFSSSGTDFLITGSQNASGFIDFSSHGVQIDTRSLNGNTSGQVNLALYGGTSGSFSSSGAIFTGSSGGQSGDANFISGGNSLSVNSIDTSGGLAGSGNVHVLNATPTNNVQVSGTNAAGTITGTLLSSSLVGVSQSIGTINTTTGTVQLSSGSDINLNGSLSVNDLRANASGSVNVNQSVNASTTTLLANGNITLSNAVTSTGGILLVAGGTINSTSSGALSTSPVSGNAGNITVIAGAAFTDNLNSVVVTGVNSSGGNVDFNNSGQIQSLDASTTSGNGGNISIAAFQGNGFNGGIILPTNLTVHSGGSVVNGNVTVVSGATGGTVNLGNFDTGSGSSGGNLSFNSSDPGTNVTIQKGTGAITSGQLTGGNLEGGAITFNSINTPSGTVSLLAGGGINLGTITSAVDTQVRSNATITNNGAINSNTITFLSKSFISLQQDLTAPGGILLVSSGGINSGAGHVIRSSSSTGTKAGDITIIAGAHFIDNGTNVVIDAVAGSGGSIDFNNSGQISTLEAVGTASGVAGGNINLLAYQGNGFNGSILLPASPFTVRTGGFAGSSNGSVTMVAGATSGNSISIGNVDTTGGTAGSGSINLSTTNFGSNLTIPTGTGTGSVSGNMVNGPLQGSASISTGSLTVNKVGLQLLVGNGAVFGAISGPSDFQLNAGGTIDVNSAISADTITLLSRGSDINIRQTLTAPGGLLLVAGGSVNSTATGAIDTSSSTGPGGNISIVAGATFDDNAGNVLVKTVNSSGGNIQFNNFGPLSALKSGSTAAGARGGDINLVAFQGNGFNGGITLPSGLTATTGGGSNGINGNVTIVSGATAGVISLSNFDTSGGSSKGDITVSSSDPGTNVTILKGVGTGTVTSGKFTGGNTEGGAISTNVSKLPTGTMNLLAGGNVNLTGLTTASDLQVRSNSTITNSAAVNSNTVTFLSTSFISLQQDIVAPGGILLVSSGGINSTVGHIISSSSATGTKAGDITIVAGAHYIDNGTNVVIDAVAGSGGSIDFNNSGAIAAIDAKGTASGVAGGNINLLAYQGNGFSGSILLPVSPFTVHTGGFAGSSNGAVTFVAGATGGNSISIGNIDTTGGSAGSGSINLSTTNLGSNLTIQTSTGTGTGTVSGNMTNGALQTNASISTGSLTVNKVALKLFVGNGAVFGAISGPSDFQLNAGGTIDVNSAISADTITLLSRGSDINIRQSLIAPGGLLLAAGGSVNSSASGAIDTSSSTGAGGNISIVAGATFDDNAGNVLIKTVNGSGGNIDFNSFGQISMLKSSSSFAGAKGGDINLVAEQGNGFNGRITLPTALTVFTGGGSGAANGNVTVVAGSTNSNMQLGNFDATGGSSNGNLTFSATDPRTNVTISKGVGTGTITSGQFTGGNIEGGSISTNAINTPTGSINFKAGGSVNINGTVSAAVDLQARSNSTIVNTAAINANTITFLSTSQISLQHDLFAPGGILLVSSGGVSSGGNHAISTSASTGTKAGDITIAAGAHFIDNGSNIVIDAVAGSGGNIDFNSFGAINALDAKGLASGVAGGNISLLAYQGNGFNGSVVLPSSTFTVHTGGFAGSANGNVTIVAGATGGNSISIGNIDTTGGTAGSGSINLSTTNFGSNLTIQTGVGTGAVSGNMTNGALQSGASVVTGSLTVNKVALKLLVGNGTSFGTISGPSDFQLNAGGQIDINSPITADTITLLSRNSNIAIRQTLAASGGILLVAGGNITSTSTGAIDASSSTGSGGNISVVAGATFDDNAGNVLVKTVNGSGGVIDFNNGGQLTMLKSSSSFAGAKGGDINLIAFQGNGFNGTVNLPTNLTVFTGGGTGGVNGNVTVVAGSTSGNMTLGNFDATGGSSQGNLTFSASDPGTNVTISKGVGTGTITSGQFTGGSLEGGSISTNTINTPSGAINMLAGGAVNLGAITNAFDLQVRSNSSIINIGAINSNTITFLSRSNISVQQDLFAPGGIVLIASGQVNSNAGHTISSSSSVGTKAGDIFIAAGAHYIDNGTNVVIDSAAGSGANIDFNNAGQIVALDAKGTASGVAGGNIQLIAYQGNGFNGNIILPANPFTIHTGGFAGSNSGAVTLVAGATGGNAITIGSIDTTGGNNASGDITLLASQPTFGASISIGANNGQVTGTFLGGAPTAGVSAFNLSTTGAHITVGGGTASLNALTADGSATGNGGVIDITTNSGSTFNVGGGTGNGTGSISANGGATSGDAGTLKIKSLGSGGIFVTSLGSLQVVSGSGGGPHIDLNAVGANLNPNTASINADGVGTNQAGGSISLAGATITTGAGLTLSANGTGASGPGGSISITTTNGASDISIGTGNFLVSATGPGGSISLSAGHDAIVAGTGNVNADNVSITAQNNVNTTAVSVSGVTISFRAVNGSISSGNVSGTSSISLRTGADLTAISGVLTTPQLNLTSDTGNIGTSHASPLSIASGTNVTANAATSGKSVFLSSSGTLNIGTGSSSAGTLFDVVATNNLSSNGTITAPTVTLQSTSGSIQLDANVVASTAVNLQTSGANGISGSGTIGNGGTLTLTQVTGAANLTTNVTSVNSSTSGSVTFNNTGAASLQVGSITNAPSTFSLTSAGDITTPNAFSAGTLVLNSTGGSLNIGNTITSSGNATLTASGAGTISGAGLISVGGANLLSLNSGNGSINLSIDASHATVNTTGGNASITMSTNRTLMIGQSNLGAGSLTVLHNGAGNDLTFGFGAAATITANGGISATITGTGNITNGGATLVSSTSVTGSSTNGSVDLTTQTPLVNLNAKLASSILNTGNLTVGTIAGAMPSLTISNTDGNISTPTGFSVPTITFNAIGSTGGNINIGSTITASTQITLHTVNANTISGAGTVAGGFLLLTPGSGSVNLNTAVSSLRVNAASSDVALVQNGNLLLTQGAGFNANSLDIQTQTGQNITIGTAGTDTFNVASFVNLQAQGSGQISGPGSLVTPTLSLINSSATPGAINVKSQTVTTFITSAASGSVTLTNTGAGTLTLASIAANSLTISTANDIHTPSSFTTSSLSLTSTGGAIDIGSNVNGSSITTLQTSGSNGIGGTGTIGGLAGTADLEIIGGTGTVLLQTNATGLGVNSAGSVTLSNSNPGTLNLLSITGGSTLVISSNGGISSSSGTAVVNSLILASSAGAITLNGNVNATSGLTVQTFGNHNISGSGLLSSGSLSVFSQTGSANLSVNTPTINVASQGNVTISDSATGGSNTVTLQSSDLQTSGNLNLTLTGTGENLSIAGIIHGDNIHLTANKGGINQTGAGSIVAVDNVSLTAGNGAVGINANISTSAATTGSVIITSTAQITDAGLSNISSANIELDSTGADINLTAAGLTASNSIALSGQTGVNSSGGKLDTATLITSNVSGSIVVSNTNASSISASSDDTVNITDTATGGTVAIQGSSSISGALNITASGTGSSLQVAGGISGFSIALVADKNISQLAAATITAANGVTLTATNGGVSLGATTTSTTSGSLVAVTAHDSITDASGLGHIVADNVTVTSTATDINLATTVLSAGAVLTLDGHTGVTSIGAGSVSAPSLVLSSSAGSISVQNAINTSQITANAQGSVLVQDTVAAGGGTVTLNASSAATSGLQIAVFGPSENLLIAGPVSAPTLAVVLGTSNGSITQNAGATITASTVVQLNAPGGSVNLGANTKTTGAGGTVSISSTNTFNDSAAGTITSDNISIQSTAGNVDITTGGLTAANSITLDGKTGVNASGGTLATNSLILHGGTGTVSVSDTTASFLTATSKGNVSIVDNKVGGIVTIGASSSSNGNLDFDISGAGTNITVTGALAAGDKIFLLSEHGSITQNASAPLTAVNLISLTANGGSVSLAAPVTVSDPGGTLEIDTLGNLTDSGFNNISAANIQLQSAQGSITLSSGTISASNSIQLTAHSGITSTVLLSTPTLTADGGTSATSGVSISNTNATDVTIFGATTASNVTDNAAGSVNLTASADDFTFTANGTGANIVVTGGVNGDNVTLSAPNGGISQFDAASHIAGVHSVILTAGNGSVVLTQNVQANQAGTGVVSIISSQQITSAGLSNITNTANLSLQSTGADVALTNPAAFTSGGTSISLDGSTGVSTSGSTLNTNALVLHGGSGAVSISDTSAKFVTATAAGNVSINDSAAGGPNLITLNASSSSAGTFTLTATTPSEGINVAGPVTGKSITLNAGTAGISQTATGTLTALNSVILSSTGTTVLSAQTKATAAGTGLVQIIAAGTLSDAGSGLNNISAANITLQSTGGAVNLTTSGLTAATSITLDGQIGVNSSGGTLSTASLVLNGHTGGINVSNTTAEQLTANASGSVQITDSSTATGTATLNASSSTTGNFSLTLTGAGESLQVGGAVSSGGTTLLKATSGAVNIGASVSTTDGVTGNVIIISSAEITDAGLSNISAPNITLQSTGSDIKLTSAGLATTNPLGTLTLTGSTGVTSTGGLLAVGFLTVSGGSGAINIIGTGNNGTNAFAINANSNGNITITDNLTTGTIGILSSASTSGDTNIKATGAGTSLMVDSPITANNITLQTVDGNINQLNAGATISATNGVSLIAGNSSSTVGNGAVTLSANVTGASVSINADATIDDASIGSFIASPIISLTSAHNITLGATLSAATAIALSASGSVSTGTLSTAALSATGTSGVSVTSTNARDITLHSNGNVFVSDNAVGGSVNINSSTGGNILSLTLTGAGTALQVNGPSAAGNILFSANGDVNQANSGSTLTAGTDGLVQLTSNNGAVLLSANTSAAGSFGTVVVQAKNQITDAGLSFISAPNITLKSTGSNINLTNAGGLTASSQIQLDGFTGVNSSGGLLDTNTLLVNGRGGTAFVSNTNAAIVSAQATGSVAVSDSRSGGTVSILNSSSGSSLDITVTGSGANLRVNGQITGSDITLRATDGGISQLNPGPTGSTIIATNSVTLRAGNGLVQLTAPVAATTPGTGFVVVKSSGDIVDTGVNNAGLNQIAASNIYLQSSGGNVTLTSGLSANGQIGLTALNNITTTGLIDTPNLIASAGNGSISISNTNATTLSAVASTGVSISDSATGGSVSLSSGSTNTGNFNLTLAGTGESLHVDGLVTATVGNVSLTVNDGGIVINKNITAGNLVSLTASGDITTPNNQIATVTTGSNPFGTTISPDGAFTYVTNFLGNSVTVINNATNTVAATISSGVSAPVGVAVAPNGNFAYVVNNGSNTVSIIQTSNNQVVGSINVGSSPQSIAINSAGTFAYVTNFAGHSVSVINLSNNQVVSTVPVGGGSGAPNQVALNPSGTFAYVADSTHNTVDVIRTSDNTVVKTVAVGGDPTGVVVNPTGQFAYVSNATSNTISVIRTADNTVVSTINNPATNAGPFGLSVDPAGTFLYATNVNDNSFTTIRTSDNLVMGTTNTGTSPTGFGNFVAFVGNNPNTYIPASADNNVQVFQRAAVIAPNISLNSSSGGISAVVAGNPNLNVSAVFDTEITAVGNVNLGASNVCCSLFVGASGSLTVSGPVTSVNNDVTLQSTSATGSLTLNSSVDAGAQLSLIAANNLIQNSGATLTGKFVTELFAGSGITFSSDAIQATDLAGIVRVTQGNTINALGNITADHTRNHII